MMACSRQPTARMREGGDHAMTSSVAAMAHVISGGIHFATTPWPPPPLPFVTRHTPVSQTLTLGRRHCMSALLVGVHHALHLDATASQHASLSRWHCSHSSKRRQRHHDLRSHQKARGSVGSRRNLLIAQLMFPRRHCRPAAVGRRGKNKVCARQYPHFMCEKEGCDDEGRRGA